ncbi:MAG: hypothetical protein WCQ67_07470 [Treponema sp.]
MNIMNLDKKMNQNISEEKDSSTKQNNQKLQINKISQNKWQVWQGREDADMLQEKQNKWHCKPNSSDDFGDEE